MSRVSKGLPIGINVSVREATALMLLGRLLHELSQEARGDLGRDNLGYANYVLSRVGDRLYSHVQFESVWTMCERVDR